MACFLVAQLALRRWRAGAGFGRIDLDGAEVRSGEIVDEHVVTPMPTVTTGSDDAGPSTLILAVRAAEGTRLQGPRT